MMMITIKIKNWEYDLPDFFTFVYDSALTGVPFQSMCWRNVIDARMIYSPQTEWIRICGA